MIYRVKGKGTELDFGNVQAAYQLLDNYPPHIRKEISIGEITLDELNSSLDNLTSQLSRIHEDRRRGEHFDWLLSRIEFYEGARETVEANAARIQAAVEALPRDADWHIRNQEVFKR